MNSGFRRTGRKHNLARRFPARRAARKYIHARLRLPRLLRLLRLDGSARARQAFGSSARPLIDAFTRAPPRLRTSIPRTRRRRGRRPPRRPRVVSPPPAAVAARDPRTRRRLPRRGRPPLALALALAPVRSQCVHDRRPPVVVSRADTHVVVASFTFSCSSKVKLQRMSRVPATRV